MRIIDFEKKGNIVRFYLGEKTKKWGWTNKNHKDYKGETPDWLKPSDIYYGDDWNDVPYEHNAGRVYDEFIKGHRDIAFDFDDVVLEPCDGEINSPWCKDDMVERQIPCIVVIRKRLLDKLGKEPWQIGGFDYAIGIDGAEKYYFGDEMDKMEGR